MAQLGHGLRFDLADTFARHAIHTSDIIQRLRLAVLQTVAHLDDASLTRRQRFKHLLELLLQQREGDGIGRCDGVGVSIRSPNSESPSSPSGVCREIGSRPYFCTSCTFSTGMSSSRASSSGVGSRPRS